MLNQPGARAIAIAALSLLVAALLHASNSNATLRAEIDALEARCAVVQPPHAIAAIDLNEARNIGLIFFKARVSELVIAETVEEQLGFSRDAVLEARPFTAHAAALALLSVALAPGDAARREMSAATAARASKRMEQFGVAVFPGAVASRALLEAARAAVHRETRSPSAPYSSVQGRERRKDVGLLLDPPTGASDLLLHATRWLRPVLARGLGSDAVLTEFGGMTSYPGATQQRPHMDSSLETVDELNTTARLWTAFVYLTDVAVDQAPLEVWPGTHTHYHFVESAELDMMRSSPAVRLAVPAGTIVLYDSRLEHRGTANASPRARPTMYFSFQQQRGTVPDGPTFTLRDEYTGALTLFDVVAGRLDARTRDADALRRVESYRAVSSAECSAVVAARCGALRGDACMKCALAWWVPFDDARDARLAAGKDADHEDDEPALRTCVEGLIEASCVAGIFEKNPPKTSYWH